MVVSRRKISEAANSMLDQEKPGSYQRTAGD